MNTPSSAGPGQLEEDLEQWKEYVDAARTVGIESVAPVVAPNDPNEPETVRNTTTEVGLWLAKNAPVYAHEDNAEGVICLPMPGSHNGAPQGATAIR